MCIRDRASPTTLSDLRRAATLFAYDAQDSGFTVAANSNNLTVQSQKDLDRAASRLRGIGSLRSGVRFGFNNSVNSVSDVLENDQYYAVFHVDSTIKSGHTAFAVYKRQLENMI